MAEPQVGLQGYVRELKAVYNVIGRQIENLIALLNEAQTSEEKAVKDLAERINRFLGALEQRVTSEKVLARHKLKSGQRQLFLQSLQRELAEIRGLKVYISLSEKKSTPLIIRRIDGLYRAIEAEMAEQELQAA